MEDLVPGRLYKFSLQCVSDYEWSSLETTQCRTIPLGPTNLKCTSKSTSSFSIAWDEPINAEFDHFTIHVNDQLICNVTMDMEMKYDFDNDIKQNTSYKIRVQTVSGEFFSKDYQELFITTHSDQNFEEIQTKITDQMFYITNPPEINQTFDETSNITNTTKINEKNDENFVNHYDYNYSWNILIIGKFYKLESKLTNQYSLMFSALLVQC